MTFQRDHLALFGKPCYKLKIDNIFSSRAWLVWKPFFLSHQLEKLYQSYQQKLFKNISKEKLYQKYHLIEPGTKNKVISKFCKTSYKNLQKFFTFLLTQVAFNFKIRFRSNISKAHALHCLHLLALRFNLTKLYHYRKVFVSFYIPLQVRTYKFKLFIFLQIF